MTSASAERLNQVLRSLGEDFTFTGTVNINGTKGTIFKNKIPNRIINIDAKGGVIDSYEIH